MCSIYFVKESLVCNIWHARADNFYRFISKSDLLGYHGSSLWHNWVELKLRTHYTVITLTHLLILLSLVDWCHLLQQVIHLEVTCDYVTV